jgi:thioredoxin-dependent peroxiredoxin
MVKDMYRAMLGKVREGTKAPMFSAMDTRGEKIDTRAHLGRSNLVLFFYRGDWCSTCGNELKVLKQEYGSIKQQNTEVLAISTDNPDEAKNLAVDLQLPFKVISDPDHRIVDEYDIYDRENDTAFITMFILDRTGTIRYKRIVEAPDDMLSAEEIVERLKDINDAD